MDPPHNALKHTRLSYLWSSSGSKDIAIIQWVSFDGPSLLKHFDVVDAEGCPVVLRVETERQLVDLAAVVFLHDTAQP